MGKKSKAQINRMIQRAKERGGKYTPPPPPPPSTANLEEAPKQEPAKVEKVNGQDAKQIVAARKLKSSLESLAKNESLKSKDRRSAKRKAEAIAQEETGCSVEDLLQLLAHEDAKKMSAKGKQKGKHGQKSVPYIVFVGQLSFDTTKESLLAHIRSELKDEFPISKKGVSVRLLTDVKTKKSRGMAFIEVSDPDLLYACLKLHHTHLDGRRINVERSAGGGRASEARKSKLQKFRQEQKEYMASTVENILQEYKKTGDILEGELDEAVVGLCTRHSMTVVHAALERYVESNGRDMDNSSAYLSFLLGKLATEGIVEKEDRKSKFSPRKKFRT